PIVSSPKLVIPGIPGVERLASHIVQHPALAGLHAGLVNAVTEHVIVVVHDDASLLVASLLDGITHRALVAFDVQVDTGVKLAFRAVKIVVGAYYFVVSDS